MRRPTVDSVVGNLCLGHDKWTYGRRSRRLSRLSLSELLVDLLRPFGEFLGRLLVLLQVGDGEVGLVAAVAAQCHLTSMREAKESGSHCITPCSPLLIQRLSEMYLHFRFDTSQWCSVLYHVRQQRVSYITANQSAGVFPLQRGSSRFVLIGKLSQSTSNQLSPQCPSPLSYIEPTRNRFATLVPHWIIDKVILDLEKENWPPRGMATNKGNMTPSRQRRKAQETQHQQQYFDVGKVGRYARSIGQD